MAQTIRNQASKTKVTYLNGKPPKKDTVDDFIYLDLQIYELVSCLGTDRAVQYLKDKIKQIKAMEGESK